MCTHERKGATEITRQRNHAFTAENNLNWSDDLDFQNAGRGFIAKLEDSKLYDGERIISNISEYDFLNKSETAPETINPSLWRLARLNTNHGLYEVTQGVYQVRGYDLSVITFIEGKTGYIVIDPLTSTIVARAAKELLYQHIGEKPILAVIYTHTHSDHWAGVKGILSDEDVKKGISVIAPKDFMDFAVSEFVLGGAAMSRRGEYMFGNFLPVDERGNVDCGLGKKIALSGYSLIEPNDYINATGEKRNLDGIEFVFQLTPEAEAPAEMTVYLPDKKALCMAEVCTHTMHNVYTIRGAQVRNAKDWAFYINEAIELFEDTEVVFASHHWPTWGNKNVIDYLKKQRDGYKYIHDQTLRLASHGLTILEIAEQIKYPKSLEETWHFRGNYGSLSHNAKAVYQRYFGFYDGNPATLNQLPPEEAGRKYVEFMGGADTLLEKAGAAFEKGEYRWVAQVVSHLVFSEPENQAARQLLADALEQLGYTAEAASWRNAYLSGAWELRNGSPKGRPLYYANSGLSSALSPENIFDLLAIRLNGPRANDKVITINIKLTDINKKYTLRLEHAVLNYSAKESESSDVSLVLTKDLLFSFLTVPENERKDLLSEKIYLEGNPEKLHEFFGLFDTFVSNFNIVSP